jgi:hypothetical protein
MLNKENIHLNLKLLASSPEWDDFLAMLFELWFEQDKLKETIQNELSNSTSTEKDKNP